MHEVIRGVLYWNTLSLEKKSLTKQAIHFQTKTLVITVDFIRLLANRGLIVPF